MHPLKGIKKDPEKDKFRIEKIKEACPYREKWYKGCVLKSHPNAKKNGIIEEHRLLASNALSKSIPKNAVVHHHNGRFHGGQLVLCENNAYHKFLHVRQRAYKATGDAKKRKCPFCKQWDDIWNMKKNSQRNECYHHFICTQEYRESYKLRRAA